MAERTDIRGSITEEPDQNPGAAENWFDVGYAAGCRFADEEAEYDDLAAIFRAKNIPPQWDIFRAEILNQYLDNPRFDFKAYAAGFTKACVEFYENI